MANKKIENRLAKLESQIENKLNPKQYFFRAYVDDNGVQELISESLITDPKCKRSISFIVHKKMWNGKKSYS